MHDAKSDELLRRISGADDTGSHTITVSLDRRTVLPILERYRGREPGAGTRSRRQSLGEVAQELIVAADELLQERARATLNASVADARNDASGAASNERAG